MDEGMLQLSALEVNKVVGHAESAKTKYFDKEELGNTYSEVYQSLDRIEQFAEDYLDEIERKADVDLSGLDRYPVEHGSTLNDFLDGISTAAQNARDYHSSDYGTDNLPNHGRKEQLLGQIREEVDRVSGEIYNMAEEDSYDPEAEMEIHIDIKDW